MNHPSYTHLEYQQHKKGKQKHTHIVTSETTITIQTAWNWNTTQLFAITNTVSKVIYTNNDPTNTLTTLFHFSVSDTINTDKPVDRYFAVRQNKFTPTHTYVRYRRSKHTHFAIFLNNYFTHNHRKKYKYCKSLLKIAEPKRHLGEPHYNPQKQTNPKYPHRYLHLYPHPYLHPEPIHTCIHAVRASTIIWVQTYNTTQD